jgi:hypothetical protein
MTPSPPQGTAAPNVAADCTPPGGGLLDDAASLLNELRGLAHDHLHLAALETKRAGDGLVTMIAAGIIVAVLLVSAWMGLLAAAVLWLIGWGLKPIFAVLLAVALNLVVALILYVVIRRQSDYLRFPETMRSLRPDPRHAEQANHDA